MSEAGGEARTIPANPMAAAGTAGFLPLEPILRPESADWTTHYPAPAKLNLFLHVVGRRPDGYHLLQTVFRFIGYGDLLRFTPRDDGAVRLATPLPGVPEASDLTVRAARLLQAESGPASAARRGVTIHLDKHLPMGGGLGGGSSDAATVLLALNHLWQLGLSRARLQVIGLSLGADVPVFVFGRNAFAEGVGDNLQEKSLPAAWYLVLVPPVQVSTAEIFGAPHLRRDTPPLRPELWQPGQGHNDLQAVAIERAPVIGDYLDWLGQYAEARMSGSGSCVFAGFADPEAARVAWQARPPEMAGWLARGLDAHPLSALAQ